MKQRFFHKWFTALCLLVAMVALLAGGAVRAESLSTGTAFVVHSDGLLLTCFHVIKDAGRIEVQLGGRTYRAIVVGTDPKRDLALLQVDASHLPALPWVPAPKVELGEEVRAFGFPLTGELGRTLKVTRGTVSGVEKEEGDPIFQIDTVINPGNSGGPLVNDRGEVVGVVVARFTDAQGVGYVASIDGARPLLRSLEALPGGLGAVRLEGPALVRQVSPSVGLVLCRPLSETGNLPAPFKKSFPTGRSAGPIVAKPAEMPVVKPVVPETPVVKPTVPETPVVKPTTPEPVAKPVDVKPVESKPADTKPVDAKPVDVKPVDAKPVEPKPEVKPAEAKPLEPKAIDLKPAEPKGTPAVVAKPEDGKPTTPVAAKPTEPLTKMTAPAKPEVAKPEVTKPETAKPEVVKPEVVKPEAGKPDVTKPAGTDPPKGPMIDVDAELAKIRASDPPEFPEPAAEACGSGKEEKSEWTIANITSAKLVILIRGAEKQAVVIEPGKTATIHLLPGKYEVAGKLDVDNITPFYGTQEFTKGSRYKSRFRIEF